MKSKTLTGFSILFVAIMAFFININFVSAETRPQANQTFTFDFEFKLRLGDTLTKTDDGNYYIVPIIGYATTTYDTEVDLSGDDAIHYKVTEITENQYNTLKSYQDEIDNLDKSVVADDELYYIDDENIAKLNEYVRNNYWWCYNQYEVGEIYIPVDCETKYYVVTVDAIDENTTETGGDAWNKHTARAYKIEADATTCATTSTNDPDPEEPKENNPKTGVTAPYIICGALALGSVIVIIVSKKEKFI